MVGAVTSPCAGTQVHYCGCANGLARISPKPYNTCHLLCRLTWSDLKVVLQIGRKSGGLFLPKTHLLISCTHSSTLTSQRLAKKPTVWFEMCSFLLEFQWPAAIVWTLRKGTVSNKTSLHVIWTLFIQMRKDINPWKALLNLSKGTLICLKIAQNLVEQGVFVRVVHWELW